MTINGSEPRQNDRDGKLRSKKYYRVFNIFLKKYNVLLGFIMFYNIKLKYF
jgi:hypothetical protein